MADHKSTLEAAMEGLGLYRPFGPVRRELSKRPRGKRLVTGFAALKGHAILVGVTLEGNVDTDREHMTVIDCTFISPDAEDA